MLRRILLEIAILVVCLAVFPVLVLALLVYTDSLRAGLAFLGREAFLGGWGPYSTSLSLWVKLFSPYLIVQAARAYSWGQHSLTGRRWAHIYFSVLALLIGGRSLWRAWDMFYFMYALGDIPQELDQFMQLEVLNLGIASASLVLFAYCLAVAVNPDRGRPVKRNPRR